MTKKIIFFISLVAVCLIAGAAVLAVWQEPDAGPPDPNVPAPINVGPVNQVKIGDICTQAGGYQCLSWLAGAAGPNNWTQAGTALFPNNLTWHIGLGTNNPTLGKLQVKPDTADAAHGITMYADSGSSARSFLQSDGAGNFNWHLVRGVTLTQGITIDRNGRVGIAKTNPSQALDVSGNISATGDICAFGGANCLSTAGGAPSNASYLVLALNGSLTSERRLTAGTGLSLVDGGANGNAVLSINPAQTQQRVTDACAAGSSIRVINQDGTVACEVDDGGAGGTIDGAGAANNIARWQDADTLTTSEIYQSGNVIGVGGNPNALSKLHVLGGDIFLDSGNNLRWISGGLPTPSIRGTAGAGVAGRMQFAVAGSYWMTILGNGRVGIGPASSNPQRTLDVNGEIYATGDICTTSGGLKCLSASGALPVCLDTQILKWSAGSWGCAADQTGGGAASDGFGVIANTAGTPQVSATAPTDTLRLGASAGSGLNVSYDNALKRVLFSADFNETQRAISGSCAGQVMVGVNSATGAVICEADDTGGVGGGVDGSGTANYIPLWQDSDTLTNSFIYQTPGRIESTALLDMNQNQIQNMVLHRVSSQAAENALNPVVGQIWIRTDL